MSNQVDDLHGRKLFGVSTDIAGVYGDPLDAIHFYNQVGLPTKDIGLEVLAWKLLLKDDTFFQYFGKNIIGFHGRIGKANSSSTLEDMKIRLLDYLIASHTEILPVLNRLTAKFKQPYYLLHHQPAAEHAYTQESLDSLDQNILPVIENHIQENAFVQAKCLQRSLNEQGNSVGFVFDIAHFLKQGNTNPDILHWESMLEALDGVGQCIIHLPIGTAQHDSIPFSSVTDRQWQDLERIIQRHHSFVTIEFQHNDIWSNMIGQPHINTRLILSTREKIKKLLQNGIISIEREKN